MPDAGNSSRLRCPSCHVLFSRQELAYRVNGSLVCRDCLPRQGGPDLREPPHPVGLVRLWQAVFTPALDRDR